MSNPTYTTQQAEFITNFAGSDTELTTAFNDAFGTTISKSALRKKRQRMGIIKTAEQLRVDWMILMGCYMWEIQRSLRDAPPVDIYEEQKQLSAAKRMGNRGTK